MRSMISMSGPLEILVDEWGSGKVTLAVECDQPRQDSQVVKRQAHEPDPRSARTIPRAARDSSRLDIQDSWRSFWSWEVWFGFQTGRTIVDRGGGRLVRRLVVEETVEDLAVMQPSAGGEVAHVVMAEQLVAVVVGEVDDRGVITSTGRPKLLVVGGSRTT